MVTWPARRLVQFGQFSPRDLDSLSLYECEIENRILDARQELEYIRSKRKPGDQRDG